jgi:hypothetical protein
MGIQRITPVRDEEPVRVIAAQQRWARLDQVASAGSQRSSSKWYSPSRPSNFLAPGYSTFSFLGMRPFIDSSGPRSQPTKASREPCYGLPRLRLFSNPRISEEEILSGHLACANHCLGSLLTRFVSFCWGERGTELRRLWVGTRSRSSNSVIWAGHPPRWP